MKGHMRRKAHNRLWTFIFTILLCTASTGLLARNVRATTFPGDPAPPAPPPPGGGDPDWPDGTARSPKPGPQRGVNQPVNRPVVAGRPSSFSVWVFKVRMAFAAAFRIFFRI